MGNCFGGEKPNNSEESSRNKNLTATLENDRAAFESNVKVLLLGAGESGKSTIFKQLRIILQDGFSKEECVSYKDAVYANTLSAMKALVVATQKFGIPLANPENEPKAKEVGQISDHILLTAGKVWTEQLGGYIKDLWDDEGIKQSFSRRNEFQIGDSAEYYFCNIERINQSDYVPSVQDVLRTRVKTTGIVETTFNVDNKTITMIDVGGQRNERKKWIHCFEGVSAVLYVSSLSEYDQKCYEDDKTNRMIESLALFEETCNSKWFTATTLLLFLNKTDIFKEKLKRSDLSLIFPEYTGGTDFEAATKFVSAKFQERNKERDRQLHIHFTCATDTDSLKQVFDVTKTVILKSAMNATAAV